MSFGLNRFEFAAWEIVGKDLFVGVTLVCHDGSTDLAQSYAMPPACTCENEVALFVAIYYEGTTVQVAAAQPFANL